MSTMADKLVTIAEYMDSMQAEMARQVLEDFDIKAVVIGENAANDLFGSDCYNRQAAGLRKQR